MLEKESKYGFQMKNILILSKSLVHIGIVARYTRIIKFEVSNTKISGVIYINVTKRIL